jgi:hypothetical protein
MDCTKRVKTRVNAMSIEPTGSFKAPSLTGVSSAGVSSPKFSSRQQFSSGVDKPAKRDELALQAATEDKKKASINPELEESQTQAVAALPCKKKMPKLYSPKEVLQTPLNRLARFTIRYAYQWPTRSPESPFSEKAQAGLSRCSCRIHGETALSCSEYGYRAFEVLPFAWALTLTFLRDQLACTPFADSTAVGKLFDEPLPFKDFIKRAKTELKDKPLVDIGDPKDLTFMVKGVLLDAMSTPYYWLHDKFNPDNKSDFFSKKGEIKRIERFEAKGDPGPCNALFNFDARRMYFNSVKAREFQPRAFENKRLNPYKIEPDKEREIKKT